MSDIVADCIFCKIIKGLIPATKIYENDQVIAFKDLRPQATIHWLFIHKAHTKNINQLALDRSEQLQDIFMSIAQLTAQEGVDETGFRVVTNQGPNAGQTVFHTHFHVLGGESLGGFGAI
jgi:histidine triad (HIT) family protein